MNTGGDFNEIKNNLNVLIDSTNEVTCLAEEIAGGNLMVDVRMRSQQDKFMQALDSMVKRAYPYRNKRKGYG